MAYKLYLTPAVIFSSPNPDLDGARVAKYIFDLSMARKLNGSASYMDYGFQPEFLVAADVPPTEDAVLLAHSDVLGFPADLNTGLGAGQVTPAKNALEAALIPGQSIQGSDTWRTVARMVYGMFWFVGKMYPIIGNTQVFNSSTYLNAQWHNVPANTRTVVLNVAASLGYDTSFIQNNTQVRAIIKQFADDFGSKPCSLGPLTF